MAVALDAKEAYVAAFDAVEKGSARRDPEYLRRARRQAIGRFEELGFPPPKHEQWKYTNLAPMLKVPFRPSSGDGADVYREKLDPYGFGVLKTSLLVFVNGAYSSRLSYVRSLPPGVCVGPLSQLLDSDPSVPEDRLRAGAETNGNPFTALNLAFLRDGAYVDIPPRTVLEEPIHLLFVSRPADGATMSHPRNLLVVGEQSQATIIETYAGWAPDVYLTNSVTELDVRAGAVVEHYKMQRESEQAYHIASMELHQGRDTNVACHSFAFGGGLVRNYVNTLFRGEGGSLGLNGLSVTAGAQQVDHYTRIDHVVPACTSLELYKGILDGNSRGVFNGIIYVRKGAQKTAARQTNKNLLLSKEAWVDSTPGLEILADDVKCNHSSTIGQLDESAVFYLRTRGIDEDSARGILTYAFATDVINQVRSAPVRIKLNRLVLTRLPRGTAPPEGL